MINFLTEKEPKMKFFDFGAFQKIKKMVSREEILFHILFEASHGTPRTFQGVTHFVGGGSTKFVLHMIEQV